MTTWFVVIGVAWVMVVAFLLAFNHGAHKDDAEDDSQ